MGGCITAFSVFESDPSTWWVATASGGLLKTTNNGFTLEHQFDREATVSIGDVAVAPSNPNVVWVGTGENNPRNSVSYGDGVYKSTDGGKSWKNMGLKKSFQIGRIVVHPKDPNVVYVGALGRLYGPSEERGLYKTTDGGTTWKKAPTTALHHRPRARPVQPRDALRRRVSGYATASTATGHRPMEDAYDATDQEMGKKGGIYKSVDGG
jgi:photosystem II stability/assembly factor-like uncharacterized protein